MAASSKKRKREPQPATEEGDVRKAGNEHQVGKDQKHPFSEPKSQSAPEHLNGEKHPAGTERHPNHRPLVKKSEQKSDDEWILSDPFGGAFIDADPVFTPDEK